MPAGTVDNPMSDRAIENKFLANAAPVVGDDRARQIAATAWKLDKLGDVRDADTVFALDAVPRGRRACRPNRDTNKELPEESAMDESLSLLAGAAALIAAGHRAGVGASIQADQADRDRGAQRPGLRPRHLRPHRRAGRSSRRSSRRCASRSSNKVGGGGVTAANYMVERKGDCAYARRLHQRLDDQSAGAAGGATKVVDMAPISRLVVEPAVIVVRADSPFKTLRDVMDAALKDGRQDQAGRRLAARARRAGAPAC